MRLRFGRYRRAMAGEFPPPPPETDEAVRRTVADAGERMAANRQAYWADDPQVPFAAWLRGERTPAPHRTAQDRACSTFLENSGRVSPVGNVDPGASYAATEGARLEPAEVRRVAEMRTRFDHIVAGRSFVARPGADSYATVALTFRGAAPIEVTRSTFRAWALRGWIESAGGDRWRASTA